MIPAYLIRDTPASAWVSMKNLIEQWGDDVKTEDGALTREARNFLVTVKYPLQGWPIQGSGWDLMALEEYSKHMVDADPRGFDYSYGNRLRAYESFIDDRQASIFDQLENVINKLREAQETRRAIMVTWYPSDIKKKNVPCMIMVDLLIRAGKLHLTAIFRSHDIARAWPANVYGLSKIMKLIAESLGVEIGTLTTFSISAHIYRE